MFFVEQCHNIAIIVVTHNHVVFRNAKKLPKEFRMRTLSHVSVVKRIILMKCANKEYVT